MNIGFVYDLKSDYLKLGFTEEAAAEFDSEITIRSIESVLVSLGHTVERVGNAYALTKALDSGKRWDIVFNIAEGVAGSGRESLVPALLDSYGIPYTFSDPLVHAITLNKATTKRMLRDQGVPVTPFIVIHSRDDNFAWDYGYPAFVKPTSEGTGKGITPKSKVNNLKELKAVAFELIEQFKQPVIVEPYLQGKEVTVGVLGNGDKAFCVGVLGMDFTEHSDAPIHSYYNKENCESAVNYFLEEGDFAAKCAEIAVDAHRKLGVQDGCRVDMRADAAGTVYIMEINTLPGLMPERSDLVILATLAGMSYPKLIGTIINSAIDRLK